MIVGFLINTCEPFYRGGYERRAWTLARELARQGHDIRIYTSCPRDERIDGVQFVRLAPLRPFFNRHGVRNGWADALFALAILKLLWKVGPAELAMLDVCATPFLHLPLVRLVTWLKRIPVTLTCHEALLADLPAYALERGHARLVSGIIAAVLASIYRSGMRLFPRRLAVSHRTAVALAREGFPARAVVEFGLEPEAFSLLPPQPHPDADPVRFIFCGRLTPIKSVRDSLAALLALRSELVPFHFDIIGEGSERSALEEMTRQAGAAHQVTFHGEVSEPAKRALLARSDFFLLSSPREGFSIATLEAMAQGCAVLVVSDPERPNGALDFVRPDLDGLCVPPGIVPMSEALKKLLRDPLLRQRLRAAAWQAAQRYRAETQAAALFSFYRD